MSPRNLNAFSAIMGFEMSKLTRGKRYANQHVVSISRMVETHPASVAQPPVPTGVPPVLRSLRGTLKKAELKEYRKHLIEKYR